jgi:microsomal epoxide hydrolase
MTPLRRLAWPLLFMLIAVQAHAADRWFTTSDGVRLHYIEQGAGRTIVMVPGWTMPAWIFQVQIADFARSYHVVALDPRGQGDSDIAAGGYEPYRRGQDIAELIARVSPQPVLLLGWSLGVLDALAYIHEHGDGRLAGMVLVDNSVGEEPAPVPDRVTRRAPHGRARTETREAALHAFVRSMFVSTPSNYYLDRLTEAALRTPPMDAAKLLAYPVPRSFWREAVYSANCPVLYMVRPALSGQAGNLAAHRPDTESLVLRGVGHAMFVDDPGRFDATVVSFIRRRVWP